MHNKQAEEVEEVSETKPEEPSMSQPTELQEEQTDTSTTEVDSKQEAPLVSEPTEPQEKMDTATVDTKTETAQEQQPAESSNPPAIIITEVGSPRSPISPAPSGGRVTRSSEARRREADSQEIRTPAGLQAQQVGWQIR